MIINKDHFLQIIEDISGCFASSKNVEEIIEEIEKNFQKIIDNPLAGISVLLNEEFDTNLPQIFFIRNHPSLIRKMSQLRDSGTSFYFEEEQGNCFYYFALQTHREFLGALRIHSPDGFYFSKEDRQLLTILTNIVTISLENVLCLQKIEAGQKNYRQIIEESTDIIYQCDTEGKFTFVNPVSVKVTGRSEEEILGTYFGSFIRDDYKPEARRFYKEQLKNLIPVTYLEFPIITKNQEEVWVGQNVQLISEGGVVKGFQAVARNITRQKEAEKAVYESESKFRALSSHAPVGIFLTDASGSCLYVNEKWCAITGMSAHEGIGCEWIKGLHPEDKEFVLQQWTKVVKSGQEHTFDFRYLDKSGKTIWVSAQAVSLKDGDNNITGFIGTITDVTERKNSEIALRELTDKMSGIFNNSYDAIFLVDAENQLILDCNPRAIEMFEMNDKTGFIEMPVISFHTEELTESLKQEMITALSELQTWTGEFKYKSNKGRAFWASVTLKMISVNGKAMELIRLTDISDNKQMEEELIHAKIQAETSMKAREQFLSVISHEIRTPMNAILGMTHLLMQEKPDPAQLELLEGIRYSADNLLGIINNILDYSKIGSGKITLEEIDFSLTDILKGIRKLFSYKAAEKNIKLRFHTDLDLPAYLKGDPMRLNQVLLNLIGNAIKFTEEGCIDLAATLLPGSDADKVTVRFTIEDTGIGIPEDKLEDVFESFTQASSETTRKYGGSGLGLSIVKKLIELQGGSIKVESTVGKGSRFTFVIPYTKGSGTSEKAESTEVKFHKFIGLRILLAEDNEMNQLVATRFLKNWDIEVDIANNGLEAVEKTKEKHFDLILMDLQMPEMDGFEAAKEIRKNHEYDNTPIIALTASVLIDVKDQIAQFGMNDYLPKPFKPDELNAKIASCLPHKVNNMR